MSGHDKARSDPAPHPAQSDKANLHGKFLFSLNDVLASVAEVSGAIYDGPNGNCRFIADCPEPVGMHGVE
jgi:hypothetical protein